MDVAAFIWDARGRTGYLFTRDADSTAAPARCVTDEEVEMGPRGTRSVAHDLTKALSLRLAEAKSERTLKRVTAAGGRGVAVVTGASGGVGRATAEAFASAGFDVALIARGEAGLTAAREDVEKHGVKALSIEADVASFEEMSAAASRIEAELGDVEVWVNDAMTTVFAPVWEIEPADFQRAVEVTFLGQVWGTMAALRLMRPRDRGTIVNVGSALAFLGIPLQSAYCSSKFACRGFFESVRAELLHEKSKVRLCMVHLPAVNTPQFDWCQTTMSHHPQPVPPIYEPEVPAALILEAALSGRRERVVGAWNKLVVLAGRLTPGFGNQYAAKGAWSTQLTSEPVAPDRPVNLRSPVDGEKDYGSHGIFDDKAGGTLDPSFLLSLPTTARTLYEAGAARAKEAAALVRRTGG